jgi:hypothetical protein
MPRYGNRDWRPSVFEPSTRRAAAVLEPGGPWVEVHAEDVAKTAYHMPEDVLHRTFGSLPLLPGWLYVHSRSEADLARARALEDERRRIYSAALARLGPEWDEVLREAANGGRPPRIYLKSSCGTAREVKKTTSTSTSDDAVCPASTPAEQLPD